MRKETIPLKNGQTFTNVNVTPDYDYKTGDGKTGDGRGVAAQRGERINAAFLAYVCADEKAGKSTMLDSIAKAILRADDIATDGKNLYPGNEKMRMKKAHKRAGKWCYHFRKILGILPFGAKLADTKNPKVATPKGEKGQHKSGLIAEMPADKNQINDSKVENSDPICDMIKDTKDIEGRTDIGETKKLTLVEARRGQGVFKKNVMRNEKKCRITGVTDLKYLQASHIKPWKDSTDKERLNGCNGLFLSPHVHYLFDKFMISFSNSGELLVSKKLDPGVLKAWGIPEKINVEAFNPAQIKFLKYHRKIHLKG